MSNISKPILFAAVLFVAAVVALPGALAATVTPDNAATRASVPPLRPEIDAQEITLAWTYNFGNNLEPLAGFQKSNLGATVNIRCADPSNILVTGPSSVNVPVDTAGSTGAVNYPFNAKFFVSVTRDLPGLKQFRCDYDVDVEEAVPSAIPAVSGGGASSFTVSAAYFGLVQASVAQQIKLAGPQKEVPYEINLENFGNARTQIQFQVEERPEGSRWIAAVPDDVILSSPTNPITATTGTAVFTVTTPYKTGWNNDQGAYRLRLNTFAADDPNQAGPDLFSNVIVRVRGVYVPGLEPVVMLGAVLGAAMLVRMQGGREDDESE